MQPSKCKFCGKTIEWDILFNKRHPFNPDGTSHMDTCPKWDKKAFGLRTLGDLDTFYRQRWQERFLGSGTELDLSQVSIGELEYKQRLRLGEALYYIGGPMRFDDWKPAVIAEHCLTGGYTPEMALVAIIVGPAILFRLRDYLGETQLRSHYHVAGLYLIKEGTL